MFMKNNLLLLFLTIISYSFFYIFQSPFTCHAVVSGECEVCHAIYPGMMEPAEPGQPQRYVLQNRFCVNCHSNPDRDTLKTLAGATVPVVFNTAAPRVLLAGGNFHYSAKNFGDRKGHNVDGVASLDAKNKGLPPGYDRRTDPSIIGYNPQKPLSCAGSNGCHGDRNIEDPFASILGTHHAEDTPVDGSTTAKSYRYLRITKKVKGVLGLEEPLWEHDRSVKKHNEYSITINTLCANCHGDYHGKEVTGKENPWLRHPTDNVLPKRGEYLDYNPDVKPPPDRPDVRVYSTEAPVARESFSEAGDLGDSVKPGRDMVMCLSCHVAHASPYNYGLRWDYDSLYAGEEDRGACMICHTGKSE
jgi:hypothetical protein